MTDVLLHFGFRHPFSAFQLTLISPILVDESTERCEVPGDEKST